jgi:hypothetical protein
VLILDSFRFTLMLATILGHVWFTMTFGAGGLHALIQITDWSLWVSLVWLLSME